MSSQLLVLLAPLAKLLVIDAIVGMVAFLIIGTLATRKRAAYAVLKRNFLAYFANPTGYVFLCLFVLLCSMAAFWPYEFFNSNLANLDQLNYWFPVIMLFFIPAITMSIWAEEKRQGTDELLLTLPADDFDIVIGKYLSAASIYTVSLVFGQLSTFFVLLFLSKGEVDTGLFCANYLGYWFIGLAMLAIGMIASFTTANLTVGFVLGAAFNAPLAFASMADVIIPWKLGAQFVSMFGMSSQFDNFGRGVISLAPTAFFVLVLTLGLYLCMVLIGRRHWTGGQDSNVKFLHYFARILTLTLTVFSLSYFLQNNDFLRYDATEGKVSSVSNTTRTLIRELKPERPIVIEAFISADIPEQYSESRYSLLTLLKEFKAIAGSRGVQMQVQINDGIEVFGEDATRAEKQYGIVPQFVRVREQGAIKNQQVILGAAIRSGLSKVTIPFFELGIPVEYELVRSINTVAQPKRIKLGIVKTDANFMGGFDFSSGNVAQLPKQPLVEELEKQYDVIDVDPSQPILAENFDVMLVVQPSSLSPQQLPNVVSAIKAGVPSAIFEDPLPSIYQQYMRFTGTMQPKQQQRNMMMGGAPPQPKGDIQTLWNAIGVEIPQSGSMTGLNPDIVWQSYNPYPKLESRMPISDQWVFATQGLDPENDLINQDSSVSADLREVVFVYSGAVEADEKREDLKFTPLVRTFGEMSGLMSLSELQLQLQNRESPAALKVLQGAPSGSQTLAMLIEAADGASSDATEAAAIEAEVKEGEEAPSSEGEEEAPESGLSKTRPIKAVYVADVDCLHPFFSFSRQRPDQMKELDMDLAVQNVVFFLNMIDVLAGEESYPKIRTHEAKHVTLKLFEEEAEKYRSERDKAIKDLQEAATKEKDAEEEAEEKRIAELQQVLNDMQRNGIDTEKKQREFIRKQQEFQIEQQVNQKKSMVKNKARSDKTEKLIKEKQRESDRKIRDIQTRYKLWAVLLPPIPPLLVGIGVFVSRRVREREGISKNRLR